MKFPYKNYAKYRLIRAARRVLLACMLLSSWAALAAPSATLTANPASCDLSGNDDFCEVTLSYSATDVPDGWVVEVLNPGFNFLQQFNAPATTVMGTLDVIVDSAGKTYGVVLNQGDLAEELLVTVQIVIGDEVAASDRDGDGVKNEDDVFPDDPTEFKDSDGDGIGDNADPTPNGGSGGGSSGGGSGGGGSSGGSGGGSSGGDTGNGVSGTGSVTNGEVALTREGTSTPMSVSLINVLQAGDRITTELASALELSLEDNTGSAATLNVGAVSDLVIEQVEDPTTDTVWARLEAGQVSVSFDRSSVPDGQASRRCPVRTPNAGVCARGTQYTIDYELNGAIGTTTVEVTEGTVELLDAQGNLIALIDAGERYSYEAAEAAVFADISGSYAASAFLMTTSSSINTTELHIVNTSDITLSFRGTLYNRDGQQLGEAGVSLGFAETSVQGRLVITSSDLEDLFGVSPWNGPAMLEVEANAPFELMSKLINPSGLVSNTNCVRDQTALNIEGFDSAVLTFVRFINTTDATISGISGTLIDRSGSVIGLADAELIDQLLPKQQIWINRDEFARIVGSEWTGEASLLASEHAGLKLLNLNFVNGNTFFNFSCFEGAETGYVFLQTTSSSANISFTHFVNTSNEAQQFRGTLYSVDGERLGAANQPLHTGTISSNARLVLASDELENIFGVPAWNGPALLEVTGSADFELMTKLTSPSGLVSNSNCARDRRAQNIEGFDSPVLSFVRLINTGDTELTNLVGSLRDSSGDLIGGANTELVTSLAPKSGVWLNRNDFADLFGETWTGEASLIVSSTDNALKILNLNFANAETFTNFSCFEAGI